MKKIFAACTSLILLTSATPASSIGIWFDEYGREVKLTYPEQTFPEITLGKHNLNDAFDAFLKTCIDTNFDRALVGKAVENLGWDFKYVPEKLVVRASVDLGGWVSENAIINMSDGAWTGKSIASVIDGGGYIVTGPHKITTPQCNLTIVVANKIESGEIEDFINKKIGKPPQNFDSKQKNNGKINKYYRPEWTIQKDGQLKKITSALVGESDSYSYIYISAIKEEAKK
jgi:hypothetical protein